MNKFLHKKFINRIFFICFLLNAFSAFSQIYVGAWNPIRYPNTGTCGWAFQDNGASGTISDPYASIEKAMKTVVANGTTNQTIHILPDAYIQNWDYDSTLAEIRDNCDGHDLDFAPTISSALNGLQIIGSAQGCLTMLEALGTSNSLQFVKIDGANNITISNIYFKGYSQAVYIDNSTNVTFTNCIFESCNFGVTAVDAILINSTSSNTSVTFNNCKFIDNSKNATTNAMNIQSNSTTASVFTTVNFNACEFVCNSKDNAGGSVYINGRSISTATPTTVNFTGGIFANNVITGSAGRGGALSIGNNCKVDINGTYFLNNIVNTTAVSSPNDGGGAIHIFSDNTGLTAASRTDVSIANALFYGNKTTSSANGGAIALIGASGHVNTNRPKLSITNTIFEKNKCGGSGGALFVNYGELNVINSTFKRDTAATGGAIAVNQAASVFTLANDSFQYNNAINGVDIQSDADFTISNCATATVNISGPGNYNWTLMDDFNRTASNTVGNGWTETETTSGTGALITGTEVQLGSSSLAGRDYISKPFFPSINAVLTNNTEPVEWAFNFRQTRSAATGFNISTPQYATAFILAATSSDFTTANGYAVIIQGSLSSNANVRLVSFTGGLTNTSWIQIGSGMLLSTDATRYCSVRVLYDPVTDSWSLFSTQNGVSYPTNNPRTVAAQIGSSTVNSTYTSSVMTNFGSLYSHGAAAARGLVDVIYFKSGSGIGTGSALTYIDGAALINSYSCTNGYCAAAVAATCLSNNLSDFICTSADATGSISGLVFDDNNGNGLSDESNFVDSVYIILYDANSNLMARYTTKTNGTYAFSGLPSGTYRVAFTPKIGLPDETLQNQNPGSMDSDIDNTFYSMPVTINTALSNTETNDSPVQALHFQNVSAGFLINRSILPLELISFNGEINNCREVKLQWKTTSEFNVDYFEIQSSQNGSPFFAVDRLPAKGNSNINSVNTYTVNVFQENTERYYRLKMLDLDGTFSYSKVVYLKNSCEALNELNIVLYPNPVKEILSVLFTEQLKQDITISITDLLGNNISEYRYTGSSGTISIDIHNLSSGTYWLTVQTDHQSVIKKIQKI